MAINASVDGTTYNGITKILTGGKTINLSYHDDGGSDLPAQVAEIKYGTYTQESDSGSTKTFEHGCASAPDIIVMWSDFRTYYTLSNKPANTIVVGECYNYPGGFKSYATVGTSYDGTSPNSTTIVGAQVSQESDGAIYNITDSTFDVLFKSNRRCGGGLKYEWLAIRLA